MSKKFDSELVDRLVIRYQQGDEEAFNQLYEYMKYSTNILIKPYKRFFKYNHGELQGLVDLGLTKAVKKFIPSKGYKFITYASYIIKGEIFHYLRDKNSVIKIPSEIYKLNIEIYRFRKKYLSENGIEPSEKEIIERFKEEASIKNIKEAIEIKFIKTLDGSPSKDCENVTLGESIADNTNITKQVEYQHILKKIYNSLDEEHKLVLREHLFKGRTQTDVGKELGYSQTQVTRMVKNIRKEACKVVWGNEERIPWDMRKLKDLTDLQRKVFLMKRVHKTAEKEIMDTLGIAQGSISHILNQAEARMLTYDLN